MLIKLTLVSILAILPALALAGETAVNGKAANAKMRRLYDVQAAYQKELEKKGLPKETRIKYLEVVLDYGYTNLAYSEQHYPGAEYDAKRKPIREKLDHQKIECAILKGELTQKTAEAKVKTAEESLAKAKDADKPAAQAALDKDKAELAAVQKFEASGDF
jgi:hypothetical protein